MLSKLLNLILPKRRTDSPGHYDRSERTRRYDVDPSPRRKENDRPWSPSEILRQIPPPHCPEPEHPAPCLRRVCATCSHFDITDTGEPTPICRLEYSIVKPGHSCCHWVRCLCAGCVGPRYGNLIQTSPELSSVCRDCRHCLEEGTRYICDLMAFEINPDQNVCSYFKEHVSHCKGPCG